MKRQGLSEDEAFKRIRKASMDSRKTMREIAEAILLTDKMG
jgi:response regulator NasT